MLEFSPESGERLSRFYRLQCLRQNFLCGHRRLGCECILHRPLQGIGHAIAEQFRDRWADISKVAVQAHGPDHIAGVVGQQPVPAFARAQRFLVLPVCQTFARFSQLTLHHQHQPPQIGLHQIVVRTFAHQLNRRRFFNHARDHDERNVMPTLEQQIKRRTGAKARYAEVRQHDVPTLLLQCGMHRRSAVNALVTDLKASFFQLPHEQRGVAGGVFDHQYGKRNAGHVRYKPTRVKALPACSLQRGSRFLLQGVWQHVGHAAVQLSCIR